MRFRAHETFAIRKGWLHKGMKNIVSSPTVFIDKEVNPMEKLGLGTNMVKALRYWLQVSGLTYENQKTKMQFLTRFGKLVWENDKYIEEDGTLYLIHYFLSSNKEMATSWYYFFNYYNATEFTKESYLESMKLFLYDQEKENGGKEIKFSERALLEDLDCIYTLAVINVKFNYTYKPENGKPVKIKDLRAHFYENGFYLDGVHYVRYKRSAGSSREGKCLFIDERLYKAIEIDKAKRTYDNVSVGKELISIRKKYDRPNPTFFKEIDEGKKEYAFYNTAMDYIYSLVGKIHFRKGRELFADYRSISDNLAYNIGSGNATEYRRKDKIVEIIDGCKARVNRLYMQLRSADEQEREVIYDTIKDEKAERDRQVAKWLTNENVLILVLRHYEKNNASDWRIYAALINHPVFSELLFELYDRFIIKVEEDENGEFSLYGQKFAKKF